LPQWAITNVTVIARRTRGHVAQDNISPGPFGSERTGYLVWDFEAAVSVHAPTARM
jgi:hypothetical protein